MLRYTVCVAGTGLDRSTSLMLRIQVLHPGLTACIAILRVIASLDFAANTVLMINGGAFIMLL
jgi:hypothetical protein